MYRVPIERDRLASTGRFELIRTTKGYRPTPRWADKLSIKTYEVTG